MKKNKGENNIINNIIKLIIILLAVIFQIIAFICLYGATSTLSEYATAGYEIIKFISVIYIIYKRQNPAYKIIWIIFLMFMPITGFIAYMIWGNNKTSKTVKKKIKNEQSKIILQNKKINETIIDENRKREANYLYNVTKYPAYYNEKTTYYKTGEECYEQLKIDLKKAEKYILIEFFIISQGKMWNEIYEILKQKKKEGIEIYLIYDSLGSLLKKPRKLKQQLEEINIKYLQFNPLTPLIRSYINYRDHRKIVVIDGKCAYTGGINIGDEYINLNSRLGYWKDCGIRITGEAVKNFVSIFFKQWNLNVKQRTEYKEMIENIEKTTQNNGFIIPYSDGPQNKNNPVQNTYLNIINNAKKYIYIMTPYLILDNETEQALINASLSGIDVKIITPSIPDKKLVNACTKSFYNLLLKSGVKIYEYTPGFIHSKVLVSDDNVATIGTANFDFRSFYLNYECGVWIHKTEEEIKIKQDYINTLEKCEEINPETWEKRKLNIKIIEAILRIISPLL